MGVDHADARQVPLAGIWSLHQAQYECQKLPKGRDWTEARTKGTLE